MDDFESWSHPKDDLVNFDMTSILQPTFWREEPGSEGAGRYGLLFYVSTRIHILLANYPHFAVILGFSC